MFDFVSIADRVHMVSIPVDAGASSINVFVLGTPEECLLVDAGHDSMAAEMIQTLEHNGIRPGSVRGIIVTHAHQDHYGAAGALAAWSGAGIWSHPAAVSQMEDPWDHFNAWTFVAADSWEDFSGLQGVPFRVGRLLREGDRIASAGAFDVCATSGRPFSARRTASPGWTPRRNSISMPR